MAFEQEVYCATCGAEFTQLRDLEFHQSVHDVKFGTSELDRLWQKDQTGAEEVTKISKPCPKCRAPLQKNNTGDQMICPRCPPQHDEASYPNPTIRHGNYYDYPAINNTMQASGALVHGTVPQRGQKSTPGPTAFWQLPPLLHNDTTGGQEEQVYARPEDIYHLYGSLPRQLPALEAPGDVGVEGSPNQTSNSQDVSEMDDERSTEME
ncbi:hypothetical protein D6D04_10856 [Aureobasidium pullulans]|nr:hypothetical protein D6D04_10856 [Aureobasidium pullulans]